MIKEREIQTKKSINVRVSAFGQKLIFSWKLKHFEYIYYYQENMNNYGFTNKRSGNSPSKERDFRQSMDFISN
jgi:hypothetical protein